MGTLVLQIAGTLLGGALGGPVGARIGGIIGAFLGNALFGEDTVQEGPRLADLTTSSSAFGTPIPWVFGTQRVGTQMVWATDIIEIRTETSSGGKGGPSQTQVTFKYEANAALLCCRGTKAIMKIWGDGKLLRDITGDQGQLESAKFDGKFRTYNGSETQEPDPTIQDDIGVDDTPAYRGTCYFVITDFPLEDFGNRIPQFTALVTDSTVSFPKANLNLEQPRLDGLLGGTIGSGGVSGSMWTADGRYFTAWAAGLVIDTFTQQIVLNDPTFGAQTTGGGLGGWRLDSNGNHVGFSGGSTSWVGVADPLTMKQLYAASADFNMFPRLSAISPGAAVVPGSPITDRVAVFGLGGHTIVYETVAANLLSGFTTPTGGNSYPTMFRQYTLDLVDFQTVGTDATGWDINNSGGAVVDRDGMIWVVYLDNQTVDEQEAWLFKFDPWAGAYLLSTQVPISNGQGFENGGRMSYDPVSHKLAVATSAIILDDYIEQYDIDTGVWAEGLLHGVHTDAGLHWNGTWAINGGIWIRAFNNTSLVEFYDFASHSITQTFDTTGDYGIGVTAGLAFDRKQNAVIVIDEIVPPEYWWLFIDREGINPTNLKVIVDAISADVGLEAAKLDTDALEPTVVKGYAINGRMPGRNALEQLRGVFFFDATESDYKMKFILRGGTSIRTLTDIDLGASNNVRAVSNLVDEARIQEVELPMRIDFQYSDENFEYQQGSQYAKRADEAVVTIDQVRMDVAVVMDATEAKNVAEVRLYLPWVEREKKGVTVTEQQLVLDATDVILIQLDDGTSFEVYIFDVDTSVDGLIEIKGVLQRPETQTFRTTTVGNEAEGFDPDLMSVASGSTFFVMDIPLLQDNDESTVPILHTAAGPLGSGAGGQLLEWNGARLDRSFDASIFTPWTFHPSVTAVDHGLAPVALAATDSPWVWDRVNTLKVNMRNGTLASATESQVLDGANFALVGKELIQFVNATLESDGSYTLDTLLRGRRGTDLYARAANGIAHSGNERFIMITVPTIQIKAHTVDNLNRLATYRALTVGATGISTKQLTPVGQSKYPLAPYLVAGARDGAGEVILTWSRRTRLGAPIDWQAGPAEPPLGEDGENYQVAVIDANGLEVRSIAITAETATYTVADQETDFGTDLDPVTDTNDFIVYQISALIGRGFPSETLTV